MAFYSYIPAGFAIAKSGKLAHEVTGEAWNSDRKFKTVEFKDGAYVAKVGYSDIKAEEPVTEVEEVKAAQAKKINSRGKKLF